jgi:hypothetical protein
MHHQCRHLLSGPARRQSGVSVCAFLLLHLHPHSSSSTLLPSFARPSSPSSSLRIACRRHEPFQNSIRTEHGRLTVAAFDYFSCFVIPRLRTDEISAWTQVLEEKTISDDMVRAYLTHTSWSSTTSSRASLSAEPATQGEQVRVLQCLARQGSVTQHRLLLLGPLPAAWCWIMICSPKPGHRSHPWVFPLFFDFFWSVVCKREFKRMHHKSHPTHNQKIRARSLRQVCKIPRNQ